MLALRDELTAGVEQHEPPIVAEASREHVGAIERDTARAFQRVNVELGEAHHGRS
jgi:hypothetical protein